MSTVISGDSTTVSNSLQRTVTAASNTTPIAITTSVAHIFSTGDLVYVTGVGGNTAANGTWTITKAGASTFQLNGSVGNGAYTSGGTATDLSLAPPFTIPDDGDNLDAASVNVALEALADRTQFLANGVAVLPSLSALSAIKVPSNGQVRSVVGHGVYVFQTSATTGLSPFRIAADDATAGGWVAGHAHETTLTRYVPFNRVVGITATAAAPALAFGSGDRPGPVDIATNGYFQGGSLVLTVSSTSGTDAYGMILPIDEFLIQGAVLSTATLAYSPANVGANPAVFPQFSIARQVRTGAGFTSPAHLRAAGFVVDSGGTYEAGTDRSLLYTADQNNTIDLATYNYFAMVFDEHGANAANGNAFHVMALAMTGIPDGRR